MSINFFQSDEPLPDNIQAAAARFNKILNDKLAPLTEAIEAETAKLAFQAVEADDGDAVTLALTFFPKLLNARDSEGETLLIRAAYGNRTQVGDALFKFPKLDFNKRDLSEKGTALTWACEAGHTNFIRRLVGRAEVDMNIKDEDGDNAIILAVQSGSPENVRLVLTRNEVNVHDLDNEDNSAIAVAEALLATAPEKLEYQEILQLIKAHPSFTNPPPAPVEKPKRKAKAAPGEGKRPRKQRKIAP